jgi:16S rRNA (guanine527-N7)-methyltransferase
MDLAPAVHPVPAPEDRAQAVALSADAVSRETWARLDAFVALLLERQQRMNLIGPSTVRHLWTRHIADSLQLLRLAPTARRWCDLGSGAGFPGLVIACALADEGGVQVHLVESIGKKAGFLRDCAQALGVPAIVHHQRIEDFTRANRVAFDVVTARALAPLDKLLTLVNPLLKTGTLGLFPKGQDVGAELTLASKSWKIEAELAPSNTDPHGRIVLVRHAERR